MRQRSCVNGQTLLVTVKTLRSDSNLFPDVLCHLKAVVGAGDAVFHTFELEADFLIIAALLDDGNDLPHIHVALSDDRAAQDLVAGCGAAVRTRRPAFSLSPL